MSADVLDGTVVAEAINDDLTQRVARLKENGVEPTLAMLRIGERPDDISYEKGAAKRAEGIGLTVVKTILPADAAQDEILEEIRAVNDDPAIHGLLMFRPLPKGVDEQAVCDAVSPEKDVDCAAVATLMPVFIDAGSGFAPCTAQACIEVLDHYGIDLEGKEVTVVGRSLVVGKPVAQLALSRNATVTAGHSRTKNLPEVTRRADVVIACVGRARMLSGEYFREGQVVIDVGINFDESGTMCGDVDYDAASAVVSAITPVPRGVGSVTTSVLCKHVVEAAEFLSEERDQ